jgi:protein-S-isoprenylcysteine O-methyltransferase Ste14
MEKQRKNFLHLLSHILLIIFLVGEIVSFFIFYNKVGNETIRNIGYGLWIVSAFLGWLPILELRKRGGVPAKQSFVKTTKLVDTGIYSICRHPQFLGGILIGFSLFLVAQHWIVLIFGILVMIIFYLGVLEGDKSALEKFGQEYQQYKGRVPRLNFVVGIIRPLKNKK